MLLHATAVLIIAAIMLHVCVTLMPFAFQRKHPLYGTLA